MSTNGRLDTSQLATIPGGTRMGGSALIRADLLPGLVGLQAAFAKRFDAPLRPTSAADGYRSYVVQVRTFLARYAPATTGVGPFSDVRWWNGTRYIRVSGASAAVPGTSNHGWAIAVDFADVGPVGGTRHGWLMDAAPRFGFVNPLWARDGIPWNGSQEPWHWEGRAVPVSNYRTFLAGMGVTVPGITAPPAPIEEDDMPLNDTDKAWITGEVHRIFLEILRAPEFELQRTKRAEQIEAVVAPVLTAASEAARLARRARDLITHRVPDPDA